MTSPKQKILIFSTAYYPFVGGAEVAVKEITDRLGDDCEFDLITAKLQKDLAQKEEIGNVTVYRVGNGKPLWDKLLLPFRGALLAYMLSKQQEYLCFWAIMASFGSGAGYICNILRSISFRKRVPMILTLQEGDSESHLKYRWAGLIGLSWKLALRNTDVLTGISNFLLNRARKNGYKGKSVLVPNGVDVSLFTEQIPENTKAELKNSLGKKEGDVFLVTVSRLVHKNATDDIISALAMLPQHVSLVVIGKGDEGPALQKQAEKLGVADRVKFLGYIPYDNIPKYFSVCDIFIRPSRSEGFGNSFIEAMASSLPVIATPVGGIVDFIDDKQTGVFCSPDNPKSIVEAVNLLTNDAILRQTIVEAGRNRVIERYDWGHIAKLMKTEVFEKIA